MADSPIQSYPDVSTSSNTKVFALNPGDEIGWVDYPEDAATEAYVDGAVSDHDDSALAHGGVEGRMDTAETNITNNAAAIDGVDDAVDERAPGVGGTTGQVWGKLSNTDYDAAWIDQTDSAPVTSVNGETGTVVLDADDIDDAGTTNKFATDGQLAAVDALGTASTQDTGDFATAAQGALADSALQDVSVPSDIDATGTADSTTFLRGDGAWERPPGSTIGLLSARPAAAPANAGELYVASDVAGGTTYRSNGSSWVQIAASVDQSGNTPPVPALKITDDAYVSTSPQQLTGDLDIRLHLGREDWEPGSNIQICSEGSTTGDELSWRLVLRPADADIQVRTSTDGTSGNETFVTMQGLDVTDGETTWIRVTRDSTTGETKAYQSDDGLAWTLYDTGTATTGAIHTSTADLAVMGASDLSSGREGTVRRFQLFDGIDGTLVADYRADIAATPYIDQFGNVWSITGSDYGWIVAPS